MIASAAVVPRAISVTCWVRRAISTSRSMNITGISPRAMISRSFSSSLSMSNSLITEDAARAGTESWIRDWVIQQGMCPFAARSAYEIVPYCGEGLDGLLMVIDQEVRSLIKKLSIQGDSQKRQPNTLVVVPNFTPFSDHFMFEETYQLMCRETEVLCSPMQMIYEQSLAPVVVQVFHPEFDNSLIEHQPIEYVEYEDPSALKYSLHSPWPTFLFQGSQDLREAWGEGDTVTRKILAKNAHKLSSIGAAELQRKLESYRNVEPEDM